MDRLRSYEHTALCAALGVSRTEVRRVREDVLEKERHWIWEGRVRYTQEGAVRLLSAFDIDSKKGARLLAEDAEENPGAETLVVATVPRNRRVVTAERYTGELVTVVVGDNELFVPGMELEADKEDAEMWVMRGRRPKRRGRW